MSVNEKMTAIADAIRDKTGSTEALSLDEMAEKVTAVYDNGHAEGKEAQKKRFFQVYQNWGSRQYYQYAFFDAYWCDELYEPLYPIVSHNCNYVFQSCGITDTKVTTDFRGHTGTAYNTFNNCTKLKTVRKLMVNEGLAYNGFWTSCSALENLTVEGVIGNSFDIRWSPLTKESIVSVVSALSDTATSKTLTLKKSTVEAAFPWICVYSTTWDEELGDISNYEAPLWTMGIGGSVEIGEYAFISFINTNIVVQKTGVNINSSGVDEGSWELIAHGEDVKDEWGDLVASKPNWTISLV